MYSICVGNNDETMFLKGNFNCSFDTSFIHFLALSWLVPRPLLCPNCPQWLLLYLRRALHLGTVPEGFQKPYCPQAVKDFKNKFSTYNFEERCIFFHGCHLFQALHNLHAYTYYHRSKLQKHWYIEKLGIS